MELHPEQRITAPFLPALAEVKTFTPCRGCAREDMQRFDGTPIFLPRHVQTLAFPLIYSEHELYNGVTSCRAEIETVGMTVAIAHRRQVGWRPEDISRENLGYRDRDEDRRAGAAPPPEPGGGVSDGGRYPGDGEYRA